MLSQVFGELAIGLAGLGIEQALELAAEGFVVAPGLAHGRPGLLFDGLVRLQVVYRKNAQVSNRHRQYLGIGSVAGKADKDSADRRRVSGPDRKEEL